MKKLAAEFIGTFSLVFAGTGAIVFRVLKPAGRLAVADMIATAPLPDDIKADWAAYTGVYGWRFADH